MIENEAVATGRACECEVSFDECKLVVLTGGPGAGKTAVLELVRRSMCEHVAVLPEAASIIFSGGFFRNGSEAAHKGAQRAIFHVQRELERITQEERKSAVGLCDRGTVDGLAYWPGEAEEYWRELGTSLAAEYSRYCAVIHLRTPAAHLGYNHSNPMRVESAEQAARLDERILKAWEGHPRRFVIDSSTDFLTKAAEAVRLIKSELPECCRGHKVPGV